MSEPRRIAIIGTGLIGASLGLALKASGFGGEILGFDTHANELAEALRLGAIDRSLVRDEALSANAADIYVLATPVLPILNWMELLAPVLTEQQLVTDVGSTKVQICELGAKLYNQPGRATFLPGHPMAGRESGGAALADATLFQNAAWLFTPLSDSPLSRYYRSLIAGIGANTRDIDPRTHDEICAWVSHLPQMLSTALSALLEDTYASDPKGRAAMEAIGGRALRETTRLGASPYSMWRDIALTNTEPIAATLLALEQRLQHMRENLRTPELREEFALANQFRAAQKIRQS
jgi:prephenate dehydrogenase